MTIGAEIIVDAFVRHGCERLYVYPGGTIAPILDDAKKRGLDIFCGRHEQGAGYAALAVSRLRQQPQVVMVTSGPGVTNLISAVADAYYDNTPLIVITGHPGRARRFGWCRQPDGRAAQPSCAGYGLVGRGRATVARRRARQ